MLSILKKEFFSHFNSLTGYLAIALYLIVTGLVTWVFPDTSIIESGYASLDGFFNLSPYLFMFLIPAVTMRSIAGEKADGTYDLLLSRPISIPKIVVGKFFGSLAITILSILPTIIYAFSIYRLGNPVGNMDIGATIGSYFGLLLLAAGYTSIGIFCSSLTNNSVIAFLLAVFLSFFFYDGFEAVSQIASLSNIEYHIKSISIQEHYWSVSRGVLTAHDFIYFCSLCFVFLLLAVGHLQRTFVPKKKTIIQYLVSLIAIVLINQGFVTSLFDRIDFTEDKRFTLQQQSKQSMADLKQDIYITLFLDGDLPAGFKRLRKAALDMANDLRVYSNNKVHINVIDPMYGSAEEQQKFTQSLNERGLFPTNLSVKSESGMSQKLIFPWAMVGSEQQEIAVNLLQNKLGATSEEVLNNSIQNLEYALVNAIQKANNEETPFIGFTEGHGEPSDIALYDAMQTLLSSNQVGRVNLDSVSYESLQQLRVMVVTKPKTRFSESDKYKIDYFVRNGGHIIWAIDQLDVSLEHLQKSGSQPLVNVNLNLDDILFKYGIRFNYDLVADLSCAQIPLSVGNVGGQPQIELVPWLFFPIIMPVAEHPIIKNLDGIKTEFIGTIDTIESTGIKKEVILQTSPFTRLLHPPSEISLQMVEENPDPNKFRTQPSTVAVLLSGQFPYIFQNRPAPDGISAPIDLKNVSKPSKMIAFSDGDWLINQISQQDQSPFPLGWDRYMNQQFANRTFLENIIDYLLNDGKLIELRNREIKLRLLDQQKVRTEKLFWQVINVAVPVAILGLFGLLQRYYRRQGYGRRRASD